MVWHFPRIITLLQGIQGQADIQRGQCIYLFMYLFFTQTADTSKLQPCFFLLLYE